MGAGVGGAAFGLQRAGEVIMGAGEVGHDPDDLSELRDGLIGRAGFGETGGEIVAGGEVGGVELERVAETFVGVGLFAEPRERRAELVPDRGLIGRDAEGCLEMRDRRGIVAAQGAGEAGVGVGARVVSWSRRAVRSKRVTAVHPRRHVLRGEQRAGGEHNARESSERAPLRGGPQRLSRAR